jgi:FG-GAP-like repeat/PASTA domain
MGRQGRITEGRWVLVLLATVVCAGVAGSGHSSTGSPGRAAPATPSFRAPHAYTAVFEPQDVSLADLNGDGKPDAVAAEVESYEGVYVLLNSGQGRLRAPAWYLRDYRTEAVTVADLNGDGKADIASALGYDTVGILLNKGNGTFAQAPQFPAVTCCTDTIAAGDVDGDGAVDLVTGSGEADPPGVVSVLINNGNGTFKANVDYTVGNYPSDLALADIDADGRLDLLTANYGGNTMSVLRNLGGTFAARVDYPIARRPSGLALADLDRDGDVDVATVGDYDAAIGSLVIRYNNGHGGFTKSAARPVGRGVVGITAADLNGDRAPELVTANFAPWSLSILVSRGVSGFAPHRDYYVYREPVAVAAADLNADGKQDLATANVGGGGLTVLLNATGKSQACAVPNVRREPLGKAKRTIAHAHCRVGSVRYHRHAVVGRGRVIAQDPLPGYYFENGRRVDLLVSRGR